MKIHAIGWTTSKIRRSTGKAGENHPTTKINGERQPHEGQCRKVGSPTQPCRKSKINGPRRNRILAVTSEFKRITLCWLCRNYYMEFRSTVYNASTAANSAAIWTGLRNYYMEFRSTVLQCINRLQPIQLPLSQPGIPSCRSCRAKSP